MTTPTHPHHTLVLHRTDCRLLWSKPSGIAAFPVEDWIHSPDLDAVWDIVDKQYWTITGDVITEMTQGEKDTVDDAALAVAKADCGEALWQGAYDVNFSHYSGGAYSVIERLVAAEDAMGEEVQQWVSNLWNEYYQRVGAMAAITVSGDIDAAVAATYAISDDFTSFDATAPHSFGALFTQAVTLGLVPPPA